MEKWITRASDLMEGGILCLGKTPKMEIFLAQKGVQMVGETKQITNINLLIFPPFPNFGLRVGWRT